ncbi:Protein of unknown function [Saccharopolyspora antimicrobica]|uniref:Uncharacterized protein DUF742 n=1 Tax=Saccharopolyspora antimicrobica TaxID=455193 RepID=A0A1I5F2Z5_9PSEU|nr:DUF742 domain-containing protein [Saccharopolyspora antimicrobica]RKT83657.1 uncharacterized protein DUF742 [Saccharopolyspora antimicrobica]SFO18077.1 Protein of unknown function [Saccharopolyspora antimicrobica]
MSRRSDYPARGRRRDSSGDNGFADVVNGFSFGSGKRKRKGRAEPERYDDQQDERYEVPAESYPDEPVEEPVAPAASSIRSYTWTGGRTRTTHNLELETLVSVGEGYQQGTAVRLEHQSIAELCQQPRSVAEVGALLSVPIGVARVLLADMAELGLITVHQTVSESGSAPHMVLMERVLSGLRRL